MNCFVIKQDHIVNFEDLAENHTTLQMPRKRTTRGQNSKIKVDLGATGNDVNSMPKAKKKVTYEALRSNFDYTLEKSLQSCDDELASLDTDIVHKFNQFRCRLSQTDLKMTLKEFLDRMDNRNLTQNGVMAIDKVVLPPGAVAAATPALATLHDKLSKYKTHQITESIPEDDGVFAVPSAMRQPRKRRCKVTSVALGAQPKPLTAMSQQNSFVTPIAPREMSVLPWGSTPFVTPKFDPRLPITPANKRKVLPGEVVMSLAGSPVSPETRFCPKTTLLMNGKEIDEIVFGDKADIPSLMAMLGNIMKKNQQADKM